MIRCCNCDKQYEFIPHKGALALPVIVCPHCGCRHTVDFKAVEDTSQLAPMELRLTSAMPILVAGRFATSGRVALGASDNINITINKSTYPEIILAFLIDEEKGPWTAAYRCDWKKPSTSFAAIAATGEIAWGTATNLTNGGTVVVGERITTTSLPAGSTWEDQPGEVEGASTSSSFALADEKSTEVQVALNITAAVEGTVYTFQIYDATGGSAIGTTTATLTITSDQPSTVLNTAEAYEFATSTPTLEFTGTDASDSDIRYNIQINGSATFGGVADSYTGPGTNTSSSYDPYLMGQSFAGNGSKIETAKLNLSKLGSPSGNVYAYIYAMAGTWDTGDNLPTGSILATSGAVDVSSLPTDPTYSNITFTFSGSNQIVLMAGNYYVLVLYYDSGDVSNCVYWKIDTTTPTHSGNRSYKTTGDWTAAAAHDYLFEINTIPLLDKLSGTDLGFANTVTPADTDPFNSAEKCDYDVQAGDALADATYYWRVRGVDPSPGSGTYGSWAATQSFIVNTGGGGFNSKVMVDGAWKAVSSASVMVDGAWKEVNSMKVMVDGAWKSV